MNVVLFPNFKKKNALNCALSACDILNGLQIGVYADLAYAEEFSEKKYVKFGRIEELIKSPEPDIRIFAINIMESLRHPKVLKWLKEIL
ncbi:MAG: HEAT repeat domain-containing protein, partial [Oscillospiraceae bacterium]|nr:HEAT repeat domain-containing protein [Oscillospiraceae bacterium]